MGFVPGKGQEWANIPKRNNLERKLLEKQETNLWIHHNTLGLEQNSQIFCFLGMLLVVLGTAPSILQSFLKEIP